MRTLVRIQSKRSNDVRRITAALFVFGTLATLVSFGAVSEEDPYERALSFALEKRYSEAWEVLGPMLEREPGHVQGRLLHGVLRAREGETGEAIRIFEALRREHPDMIEPYNNLAVLYALEGRLEAARETLVATLERSPDAIAYTNLGDVYGKLARRAYERARELEEGGVGRRAGEVETAHAMPVPAQGSSEAAAGGVEPDPGAPAMEPAATARDAASESGGMASEGQAPAASGLPDTHVARTVPAGSRGTMASAFCARAVGFAGRRAVAEAALWLQSYGAEVLEVRQERGRTTGPFRVYLPPFATVAEAEEKLREVRDRGVRDVVVIRAGALANGISFGLYREEANMRRRVAALGRLGYSVQSLAEGSEGSEGGDGYAIEARAGGAAAEFEAAWTSQFPERPIRVVECG